MESFKHTKAKKDVFDQLGQSYYAHGFGELYPLSQIHFQTQNHAINAGVFGVKGNEKQEEIVTGEWHWKVTLVICMFFLICSLNCSWFVSFIGFGSRLSHL